MADSSSDYIARYREWRDADAAARVAEDSAARELFGAIDRREALPGPEVWSRAKELRRTADEKLQAFMRATEAERASRAGGAIGGHGGVPSPASGGRGPNPHAAC
jgi:hypothetical protein